MYKNCLGMDTTGGHYASTIVIVNAQKLKLLPTNEPMIQVST